MLPNLLPPPPTPTREIARVPGRPIRMQNPALFSNQAAGAPPGMGAPPMAGAPPPAGGMAGPPPAGAPPPDPDALMRKMLLQMMGEPVIPGSEQFEPASYVPAPEAAIQTDGSNRAGGRRRPLI